MPRSNFPRGSLRLEGQGGKPTPIAVVAEGPGDVPMGICCESTPINWIIRCQKIDTAQLFMIVYSCIFYNYMDLECNKQPRGTVADDQQKCDLLSQKPDLLY